MTKYGHYVAALDRDSPAPLRGSFINYKRLKKCLKACRAPMPPSASTNAGCAGADADGPGATSVVAAAASQSSFFELLNQEVEKINRCFVSTANAIVSALRRTEIRRRLACCFPRLLGAGPGHYAQLAERAYWCRKYARANALGLRKILKKHDKVCGGQRGRHYLQQCWRQPTGGAFLHSPLLDELKAIQDLLQDLLGKGKVPPEGDLALCEVADTRAKVCSLAVAAMAAGATAGSGAAGGTAKAKTSSNFPPGQSKPLLRALLSLNMPRAGAAAGDGNDSTASYGVQPLQQQQQCEATAALVAIMESSSPTCMMSSSDFECHPDGGCSSAAAHGIAIPAGHQQQLQRDSQDASMLSSSIPLSTSFTSCSWLGTSSRHGLGGSCARSGADGGMGLAADGMPLMPPGCEATALTAGGAGNDERAFKLEHTSISCFREEELRCSICLDALYKPVGLACGHKFCKQCALDHAGLRHAIGTFSNLCSYISSRVKCPQCRQPSVYAASMRLRQLDRVLRARWPEEWQERRQEEKARERGLAVAAASSQPARRWAFNVHDAVLGL